MDNREESDAGAPLRWGITDADDPMRAIHRHPKAAELFKDFGFDTWITCGVPKLATGQRTEEPGLGHADTVRRYMREIEDWCAGQGLSWMCDLSDPNFAESFYDEQNRDWYNHADGRHYFLFPDELLEELGAYGQLLGLMYNEPGHMQLSNNFLMQEHRPFIYDYRGDRLEDAADRFTEAARAVAEHHARFGVSLYTVHIVPVLFHGFARAGYTIGTRLLREHWSPAYLACAMGAALQYGTDLWIDADLFQVHAKPDRQWNEYPGHSPETYRSALLLGYHMGADVLYTENLAYDQHKNGVGSIVVLGERDYRVTDIGEVTRWFIHEYAPAYPRRYTFRSLKPRVAIVRQPDTCWGQATSWLPDQLFGNREWKSTPVTTAWLGLWELLSGGVISKDGLSWHALGSYVDRPYQLFCPMDGVVVFDHHVGEERLSSVEVIFLTGLGVSPSTLEAVEACVSAGAVCVALAHLAPERIRRSAAMDQQINDGKGTWLLTTDFLSPAVKRLVHHILPDPDTIRYQFGDVTVRFHPADGDPNRLEVEIQSSEAG